MRIIISFFLTVLIVGFSSCVETVPYDVDNSKSKIFVIANWEKSQRKFLKISSITGLADTITKVVPTDPKDIDFKLYQNEELVETQLEYNSDLQLFELINLQLEDYKSYQIKLKFNHYDFPEVQSNDLLRISFPLKHKELIQSHIESTSQTIKLSSKLLFKVNPAWRYYEFRPYIKIDNERIYVDFDLEKRVKGAFVNKKGQSLYLDEQLINDELVVHVYHDISDIDTHEIDKLYFEINAVSELHYDYFVNEILRQESETAILSEPITFHSNIENGFGVFSVYNSLIDSIQIN